MLVSVDRKRPNSVRLPRDGRYFLGSAAPYNPRGPGNLIPKFPSPSSEKNDLESGVEAVIHLRCA